MKKTNNLEQIRIKLQIFTAALAILLVGTTAAHANINVTPPSVNFGTQSVGSASASQTVTVTNENKRSVKIVRASNSVGQFSFSGPSLPVVLTTGQSYTATVTFNPSAAQTYSGVVVLTRANGQTISIPLSGTGSGTTTPSTPPSGAVAPTISSQPASAKIVAGQTAIFNVAATGTAPIKYQWKRNGAMIAGANSSTYTTPAVTTADNNATFAAVVSNTAGSATSSAATLTVSAAAVAPTITTQPASQTISSGKTATFTVAATGTGPLMYQWAKGGVAISGANAASYTTPAETAGAQFTVTVANTAGTVTSNPATLTVSAASTLILNSSASSLNFGNVNMSSSSNQSVTLTNGGNSNITISNVTVSGAGFNASGVSSGLILTPGQSAALTATFAPAAAGSAKGSISVASNATNSPDSIALSGTGVVAAVTHSVALSWSPSTSVVTGYNTYASQTSGGPYTKLTGSPVAATSYTDTSVQAGATYFFVVTSVDASNVESVFSSEVSAQVP